MDITGWIPFADHEADETAHYNVRTHEGAEHRKCRYNATTDTFRSSSKVDVPGDQVSHVSYYSKLD